MHLRLAIAILAVLVPVLPVAAQCPDSDLDGIDDCHDNCPFAYNPYQVDTDGDGVGDICDNCWWDYNPAQTDFDGDAEGDRCDLDDGLIYIYRQYPGWIDWQQELLYGGGWNLYEGDLSVLKGTGVYTQEPGSNPLADRRCGLPNSDTYAQDIAAPEPGQCVFELVTGIDPITGVEGPLGPDPGGPARPNTAPCP